MTRASFLHKKIIFLKKIRKIICKYEKLFVILQRISKIYHYEQVH